MIMNKKSTSPLSIFEELEQDSNINYEKTATRMRIAIQIDDAIKAMGMSQIEFAQKLGQRPSVISKWLSGTHNFTSDTLTEISNALNINIAISKEEGVSYMSDLEVYADFIQSCSTIVTAHYKTSKRTKQENYYSVTSQYAFAI